MRINAITNQCVVPRNKQTKKKNSFPIFGNRINLVKSVLADKNIQAEFNGNAFLADCIEKIVYLFESLYGKKSLPKKVLYESFEIQENNRVIKDYAKYGTFNYIEDIIRFNSNMRCFDNMENLKIESKNAKHLGIKDYSSLHPACTFVHEFAHSAHKANIIKHGRNAVEVMTLMQKMFIPTSVGRLITKFKLGRYAAKEHVNEFMAERVTQDVCNALVQDDWVYWRDKKNVHYDDIFRRKWNCRYTSPQSYLDYYTQQIWNGDIRASIEAGDKIKVYLAEIDRQAQQEKLKQKSFWGAVDLVNAKIGLQANWLDRRNRLGFYIPINGDGAND